MLHGLDLLNVVLRGQLFGSLVLLAAVPLPRCLHLSETAVQKEVQQVVDLSTKRLTSGVKINLGCGGFWDFGRGG